jgi:hypothetical protein
MANSYNIIGFFVIFIIAISSVLLLRKYYKIKIYKYNDVQLYQTRKFINTKRQYNKLNEINLVYIGSSQCIYCEPKLIRQSIEIVDSIIRDYSYVNDIGYVFTGLSQDKILRKGLEHLFSFDLDFHEVSVGNSWRNHVISTLTNDDFQHSLITPQLLIVAKTYADTTGNAYNEVIESYIIERFVGSDEINTIKAAQLLSSFPSSN